MGIRDRAARQAEKSWAKYMRGLEEDVLSARQRQLTGGHTAEGTMNLLLEAWLRAADYLALERREAEETWDQIPQNQKTTRRRTTSG